MKKSAMEYVVPRLIALLLTSVCAAWLFQRGDHLLLAKMDAMSPADYFHQHRATFQRSYLFHFVELFFLGGFYYAEVEVLAFFVSLGFPKKPRQGLDTFPRPSIPPSTSN
jgi:hypothetical protein